MKNNDGTLKIRRKFRPNVEGAWQCLPMAEYQAAPGLSKSQLDRLHASPLRYAHWLRDRSKRPEEPTWAMQWGSLVHTAILEPQHLKGAYVVRPDTYGPEGKPWNNNANECKLWNAEHAGTLVISSEQEQEMRKQSRLVRSHPIAGPLLKGGRAEVACFAGTAKPHFCFLKGRMDYLRVTPDEWTIVDVKTTRDASTRAFSREIFNRRYHVQAAMYRRIATELGAPRVAFVFIAIDKTDPECPLINVRRLAESAIDIGEAQLDADITLLSECRLVNEWPHYPDSEEAIGTIDLPDFCYNDEDAAPLIGAERVTEAVTG